MSVSKQELEKAYELIRKVEENSRKESEIREKAIMKSLVGTFWRIDNEQLHRESTLHIIRYYGSEYSLLKEEWYYYHDSHYGCKVHDTWHTADKRDADIQISKLDFNKIKKLILDKIASKGEM